MADLTPISSFDDVPQLETTTQALGGPGGPMNTQAQALLNRTQYLKDNSVDMSTEQNVDGVKTFLQTVQFKWSFVIGSHPAADFSWYAAFPNSSYITIDKPTEQDDATTVLTVGGVAKWEYGAATEVAGHSNDFHVKRVTGTSPSQVFTDVFMVDYDTGNSWIPNPFQLGIGGLPQYPLHVVDESNGHTAGRVTACVQNYNTSGSGSQSAQLLLSGLTYGYTFGVDYGLNGGDDWYISSISGTVSMLGNSQGVTIGASGALPAATEVLRLDSNTQGFLPPRLTSAERDAMGGKNAGLMVFNTDVLCPQWWNSSAWISPVDTSTAQTIGGAKTFSSSPTFSAGITITGGAFGPGNVYYSPSLGTVVAPKAGSAYDFDLVSAGSGLDILTVPTGTRNLTAWGDLLVNGNIKPLNLINATDDAAAATAGVPVGALYRNGSVLMIRVA